MKENPQGGNTPAKIEKIEDGKTTNLPAMSTVGYTLAPLIEDGRDCLVCRDVAGMEWVVLESVEFYFGGSPWQRVNHKSNDIFALVENGIFKWPPLNRISAARFRVRLKVNQRPMPFTICPAGGLTGRFDGTRPVIEDWLLIRKFRKASKDEA